MRKNTHGRKRNQKALPAEECNVHFIITNNRENRSSLIRTKNKAKHYFE